MEEQKINSTYNNILEVLKGSYGLPQTLRQINKKLAAKKQCQVSGYEVERLGFAGLVAYLGKDPYYYTCSDDFNTDDTSYVLTQKGFDYCNLNKEITGSDLIDMIPEWQGYIRGDTYPNWRKR